MATNTHDFRLQAGHLLFLGKHEVAESAVMKHNVAVSSGRINYPLEAPFLTAKDPKEASGNQIVRL